MPATFARAVTHHPPSRRSVTLTRVERVTPVFVRVTLSGADLDGFPDTSPDDHVTVHLPDPAADSRGAGTGHPEPASAFARPVTPRAHRPAAGGRPAELDLDLLLHGGDGLAATWAQTAAVGDRLVIDGPDTSTGLPDGARSVVLLGDESALPAIARWLELLPDGVAIAGLIEVRDARASGYLPDGLRMRADILWLQRDHGAGLLTAAVRAMGPLDDTSYVFGAGEAAAMDALRRQLRHEQGATAAQLAITGYWREGARAD